jgi:cell wall assembly regulator SMI1
MKAVALFIIVSAMPLNGTAQTPSSMKEIIQKIDAHLKKNAPVVYQSLNPPLTAAQIHELEVKHKITLPPDLKEIYLWKNGQNLEGDYNSFFGNKTLLPLEQALATRDELNEMLFAKNREVEFQTPNWWNKDWIPLFENGGGDYVCYDAAGVFTNKTGQILDYYHDEYYRMVNAPSLVLFLEAVQRVYDKKYDDDWDSLKENGDYPKSYQLKEDK